jgi:TonB family protein
MRSLVAALVLAPFSPSAAQQVSVDTVANPVFEAAALDEQPQVVSGPPLRYPDALRKHRITGRVLVQAIIDTRGRAEPKSIVIVSTPDRGFNDPVRDYIRGARFRPGRIAGRAVRTRVTLPINYGLIGP